MQPKQLARFVEELPTMGEGKLTMQLYWLPVNASWLDQIEIWFSVLQRKLLQPNHFCSLARWLIQIMEICFVSF